MIWVLLIFSVLTGCSREERYILDFDLKPKTPHENIIQEIKSKALRPKQSKERFWQSWFGQRTTIVSILVEAPEQIVSATDTYRSKTVGCISPTTSTSAQRLAPTIESLGMVCVNATITDQQVQRSNAFFSIVPSDFEIGRLMGKSLTSQYQIRNLGILYIPADGIGQENLIKGFRAGIGQVNLSIHPISTTSISTNDVLTAFHGIDPEKFDAIYVPNYFSRSLWTLMQIDQLVSKRLIVLGHESWSNKKFLQDLNNPEIEVLVPQLVSPKVSSKWEGTLGTAVAQAREFLLAIINSSGTKSVGKLFHDETVVEKSKLIARQQACGNENCFEKVELYRLSNDRLTLDKGSDVNISQ